MLAPLLLALSFSLPGEAKLVKVVISRPNEIVTRETLRAAKACEGKERRCSDGRRAGLVLPSCQLVCPEDNRKDLACYKGMIDDADPSEFTWEERPEIPGTPILYSASSSESASDGDKLNCTVFELLGTAPLPVDSFLRPASHRPSRVRPAL